ncbi:stress protein [Streptomyces sp. TRM64462]|uniref:stress protein n=1 Tax=Streptomyces sp. TRM64462 TaxID=2741726 RepID=UPI00158609BD|nr:stress protein [Streptomyces sp. TRM64462]
MRRSTALATLALTAAALVGGTALPAQAAERPTGAATASPAAPASALPAAQAKSVTVKVAMDQLGAGNRIADALRGIKTDDRGKFVQEAVNKAFDAAGGRHNVMLMNLSQNYQERLQGKRLYANVQWGNIYYGLWIAESGAFTNQGDGGWINWGFKGWFDRDGGHVRFHRSW